MNNAAYAKLTSGLITAWFVLAFTASYFHAFLTDDSRPPLAFGIAILLPLTVFFVWFAASASFRGFTLSLNPHTLTLVHSWRVAGFTFLALYSAGLLPAIFALPAGLGDMAIGLTSYLAAQWSSDFHLRRRFIVWQVLGIFDLVLAITLGTVSRLIDPHGTSTAIMTTLPMSLIPTFAVPMLIMLHVICIAQARQRKASQHPQVAELFHRPA